MVDLIKDPFLSRCVYDRLESSPGVAYVRELQERFSLAPVLFWGGFIRDAIIQARTGKREPIYDVDMLIDDSQVPIDFEKALEGIEGLVDFNRFGNPKWIPASGLDIDIVPVSKTNLTRIYGSEMFPPSVENTVLGCDLTTSALAYDLASGVIYNAGALEGIEARRIGINYAQADDPYVLMARVALHADKLKFGLDNSAINFIREHYQPSLEKDILAYLRRKGHDQKEDIVLSTLRACAHQGAAK